MSDKFGERLLVLPRIDFQKLNPIPSRHTARARRARMEKGGRQRTTFPKLVEPVSCRRPHANRVPQPDTTCCCPLHPSLAARVAPRPTAREPRLPSSNVGLPRANPYFLAN